MHCAGSSPRAWKQHPVLLLQDHFAWRQDSIGFCIGMTFCLVVPGYMLHKQYQARYSDIAWIRIYHRHCDAGHRPARPVEQKELQVKVIGL